MSDPTPQHAQNPSHARGEARPRKDRHVPRGPSADASPVERAAFRPPPTDLFCWEDFCCPTCLAHGQQRMHRNGECPRARRPGLRGSRVSREGLGALLALRDRLPPG